MPENQTSLQDRFLKWCRKAASGERGYKLLRRGPNGWELKMEDVVVQLSSLCMFLWNSDGVKVHRELDDNNEAATILVVKGNNCHKIMVADDRAGLYSFGTSDDASHDYKLAVHFQVGTISTLIVATEKPRGAVVSDYIFTENDPMGTILQELFSHRFPNDPFEEGKSGVSGDA